VGLLVSALLALLAGPRAPLRAPAACVTSAADWPALFAELARFEAQPSAAQRAALEAELAASAAGPRAEVIAWNLAQLAGENPAALTLTPEPYDFAPQEAWYTARAAAAGPWRTRAVIAALETEGSERTSELVRLAFDVFVEATQSYRTEEAQALARAMHARAGAVWSAASLAQHSIRAGLHAEALATLRQALADAASADRLYLLQTLGMSAFAGDNVELGFQSYGAALIGGGTDAYQVLAFRALRGGSYARARAVFRYEDTSRRLILGLKHGDRTHTAPALARMLHQAGAELLADAEVIVPVPLHWRRLVRRRFNQAAMLALVLGRDTGIPVIADALIRTRATPPQGRLNRSARRRNVRGAFQVRPARTSHLNNRRVLLVDDVLTTGATVEAVARCLLRNGAAAVDVLVLSRVVRAQSE